MSYQTYETQEANRDGNATAPTYTCRCGEPLRGYDYADQNSDAGQGFYDAWATTDEPFCRAATRADVLLWRTDFRRPAHDVCDGAGMIAAGGQCQETEDGPR